MPAGSRAAGTGTGILLLFAGAAGGAQPVGDLGRQLSSSLLLVLGHAARVSPRSARWKRHDRVQVGVALGSRPGALLPPAPHLAPNAAAALTPALVRVEGVVGLAEAVDVSICKRARSQQLANAMAFP